jgi:putative acetyltransferase
MSFTTRAMTIADYAEVMRLWETSEGIGLSSGDSPEAIARYLARNPGMSLVAIGEQGEVAGAVLCGHDGRRGYLHHLAVRPEYQRQGLGRALVDACLARLAQEGIDKCHIFVHRTNTVGQAFWQAMDWTERKSLIIMSKDIER